VLLLKLASSSGPSFELVNAFRIDLGFLRVLSKSNKRLPDLRQGAGLELSGRFEREN